MSVLERALALSVLALLATAVWVVDSQTAEGEGATVSAQLGVPELLGDLIGELSPSEAVVRQAGADRVGTAAAVSRATFPRGTRHVVLVTARDYPDALAGSSLAGAVRGPVLLTSRGSLAGEVRDELRRLSPDAVTVLGGTAVVSEAVVDEVRALGIGDVRRVHGATRFETAAQAARRITPRGHAYLVQGQHRDPARGWPDGVAVSALAAAGPSPVLLATRNTLPEPTARVIDELGVQRVTIVGGHGAISPEVAQAVAARGVEVERLSGPSRYATSAEVARRSTAVGLDATRPWLVTGQNWPDALAAGPAAAHAGAALALVHGVDLDRSAPVGHWLVGSPRPTRATLVGGAAAISGSAELDIRALTGLADQEGHRVAAAGDIACDPADPRWGAANACRHADTAVLAAQADSVLALGDLQYQNATLENFLASYDPTWGAFKDRTYPTPGNHEYDIAGARDYFAYFGGRVGEPGRGYYAVELGDWLVLSLDSNCGHHDLCEPGSAQQRWLAEQLATSGAACTMAFMHHPRHSAGQTHGSHPQIESLYTVLQDGGVDLLVAAHAHKYERMRRADAQGVPDPDRGLRSFVVGTGGRDLRSYGPQPHRLTVARTNQHFGVLRLELYETGYTWAFDHLADSGHGEGPFIDVGFGSCRS